MVSSPQNRSCSTSSNPSMIMKSSFGHFVDEALTATPIRSNIATVVSHSPTKAIPPSFSTTTGDNNEYNAMLLDLHRDSTKNAHKHNLRRLKKLRRQRVNHGSLKAASIVQSMPKPQQTIASPNGEEFPSKNIHIDEQHHQQQDYDQDMSGGSSTATASTTMTRRHRHRHQYSGRDDDAGCKLVVVKKKQPKNNSTKRASNKLWTKIQRRRTKRAVTKSLYVREWKRNGPFLQPEEPSAAPVSDDKSSKPGDDPKKMAAMKKEKKRIKKKLKRDVVELSFDLNSLRV
mmetsp:Transcript_4601/g.11698  ORF Transcript_4601/g.11698 Transcript_4601/m.11698 type:complete len:287 (-) Transcript_4601:1106-1966(-)